jgi:hypothetical protein
VVINTDQTIVKPNGSPSRRVHAVFLKECAYARFGGKPP